MGKSTSFPVSCPNNTQYRFALRKTEFRTAISWPCKELNICHCVWLYNIVSRSIFSFEIMSKHISLCCKIYHHFYSLLGSYKMGSTQNRGYCVGHCAEGADWTLEYMCEKKLMYWISNHIPQTLVTYNHLSRTQIHLFDTESCMITFLCMVHSYYNVKFIVKEWCFE